MSREWSSLAYSALAEDSARPGGGPLRRYARELQRLRRGAQHAVVVAVVAGGSGCLGLKETELCSARWVPPWRDPEALVEALEGEVCYVVLDRTIDK